MGFSYYPDGELWGVELDPLRNEDLSQANAYNVQPNLGSIPGQTSEPALRGSVPDDQTFMPDQNNLTSVLESMATTNNNLSMGISE